MVAGDDSVPSGAAATAAETESAGPTGPAKPVGSAGRAVPVGPTDRGGGAELRTDYAKKYFDLGNAVTGFAVVQMITFLVAFGTSKEFANQVASAPGWNLVIAGSIGATALYLLAVAACGYAERRLLGGAEPDVARALGWTVAGRLIAIAAISAFGLAVLCRVADQIGRTADKADLSPCLVQACAVFGGTAEPKP